MSQLTPTTNSEGLIESQVQSFRDEGFLVIDAVFPEGDINLLREACESREVTRELKSRDFGNRGVHLLEITIRHPLFMELAKSSRLVECLVPLIGPDIQLQHSKLATKPPAKGKGAFNWHQDLAYFPHTNCDLVAVMVMLDDATRENGCMQVVRGSHKMGVFNHDDPDGIFRGQCQDSSLWADPAAIEHLTPKAGGISIHHCLALHGSPANRSGRPRRGVVFQYRADDAFQLADGIWKDTGLLISGERRERVRCDAGVLRLPRSKRYPGRPFGDAWNQHGSLARQENSVAEIKA
jgi:phytanoyl-CoA hydroxylase